MDEPARPQRKRARLQADAGISVVASDAALPVPRSPSELWHWVVRFAHRLQYNIFQVNFLAVLISKLLENVHTVTDFSGLGAPEIAAHHILAFCQRHVPSDVSQRLRWHFGRASDFSRVCRQALALHGGSPTAPACILGDQTARVPRDLLARVKALYDEGMAEAQERIKNSGERATDVYKSVGERVFAMAADIFFQTEVTDDERQKTAYCYRHKRQCPIQTASGSLRGCVAGVLCYDFSSRGHQRGLLAYSSSILLLIWIRERLLYREDWAVVECVPGFNHGVFKYLAHLYDVFTIVVCSSLFGAPSTRRRKLMFLLKKTSLRWSSKVSNDLEHAFKYFFSIPVMFTSEIYFNAPKQAVSEFIQRPTLNTRNARETRGQQKPRARSDTNITCAIRSKQNLQARHAAAHAVDTTERVHVEQLPGPSTWCSRPPARLRARGAEEGNSLCTRSRFRLDPERSLRRCFELRADACIASTKPAVGQPGAAVSAAYRSSAGSGRGTNLPA